MKVLEVPLGKKINSNGTRRYQFYYLSVLKTRQKLVKVNNKFYDWGDSVSHAGAPVNNISLLRLISPAVLINFNFKKYKKDIDISRVTAT